MAPDEDLKRKIDEIQLAAEAKLNERIAHMADDPAALKKHLLHLSEVFNNQVALIHMYREYVHDINAEVSRQCNKGHRRAQLETKPLTQLLDKRNRSILEARRLCRKHDPETFCKTSLWKLTGLTPTTQENAVLPEPENGEPAKPSVSDGHQAVLKYLSVRFGWLDSGPEKVYITPVETRLPVFMRFLAEVRLGNRIEIAYGSDGKIRWTNVPQSPTLFNPADWKVADSVESEREMFMALFGFERADRLRPHCPETKPE